MAGTVSPAIIEFGLALVIASLLVAGRIALTPLIGDRAPYLTVALGMVLSTLLAGWRSGLMALVVGQVLTWYWVIEPVNSFAIDDPTVATSLVVATMAQLIILLVLGLYQREVDRGVAERERRMELLGHALAEIDHRTRNNYQTVMALVHLQAQRSDDPNVRMALEQVAERIGAIAAATAHLGVRSEDIATVRLSEHLGKLCDELKRGFANADRRIDCSFEDVAVSTEKAAYLAIIVNELVTNALKHAFADGDRGTIRVSAEQRGGGLELSVADDGRGFKPSNGKRRGIGMSLVQKFAGQIGATHELVSSDRGTVHHIRLDTLH